MSSRKIYVTGSHFCKTKFSVSLSLAHILMHPCVCVCMFVILLVWRKTWKNALQLVAMGYLGEGEGHRADVSGRERRGQWRAKQKRKLKYLTRNNNPFIHLC